MAEAVAALEQAEGRTLLIQESRQIQTLLAADLIDAITIAVFPIVLGSESACSRTERSRAPGG